MALGSKLGYKRVHIGPISECPKPKTDKYEVINFKCKMCDIE